MKAIKAKTAPMKAMKAMKADAARYADDAPAMKSVKGQTVSTFM